VKEENEGTDHRCRIRSNRVQGRGYGQTSNSLFDREKGIANYPRGNTVNGRMNVGMNVGPVKEENECFVLGGNERKIALKWK
jgi:hypothetical protein